MNPIPPVIDSAQLRRIESTHRGFFCQHLFGVGCLLVAEGSGTTRVIVERDEDLELERPDSRIYVQVKTRSTALEWHDISVTVENFQAIRDQHTRGDRNGTPLLAIVCNVEASAGLQERYRDAAWPADIQIYWPSSGPVPAYLPEIWQSVGSALTWCSQRAEAIAYIAVPGDVLVWKLAAIIQCACAGEGKYKHAFAIEETPELFNQVVIQLQSFPDSPTPYISHTDEPPYASES